jgi:hypothetical protein
MTSATCRRTARSALAAAGAALAAASPATSAGPPAAAFVPDGFRIEKRIDAQLGGDARKDTVLVLVQRPPATPSGEGGPPDLRRRLVMLKARADGGYVLMGEGRRILLSTRGGGAFFGSLRTPVTVRVARRVVIVEQRFGSRELTFQRFRVWFDGATSTRLIGTDISVTDRLTGATREVSTNHLTGARIVTVTRADGTTTRRSSTVRVRRTPLEAVNLSAF